MAPVNTGLAELLGSGWVEVPEVDPDAVLPDDVELEELDEVACVDGPDAAAPVVLEEVPEETPDVDAPDDVELEEPDEVACVDGPDALK